MFDMTRCVFFTLIASSIPHPMHVAPNATEGRPDLRASLSAWELICLTYVVVEAELLKVTIPSQLPCGMTSCMT
jgi:hypothetical protein